jgi:hypothetical protein
MADLSALATGTNMVFGNITSATGSFDQSTIVTGETGNIYN